jgi:hypothetical protein
VPLALYRAGGDPAADLPGLRAAYEVARAVPWSTPGRLRAEAGAGFELAWASRGSSLVCHLGPQSPAAEGAAARAEIRVRNASGRWVARIYDAEGRLFSTQTVTARQGEAALTLPPECGSGAFVALLPAPLPAPPAALRGSRRRR